MMQPKEVTDVFMAFPGDVSPYMPDWSEIPAEYKQFLGTDANKLFSEWFYKGLKNPRFHAREGVNAEKAYRHIVAIMKSFQPKHEHKEAACAYLLDLWFEKIERDPT